MFQIQNLKSLETIFPKLSIIRGHKLFKKYALIIFLTNSLLQINLKNLVHIQTGSILLSRLYHSCYINTIDWNYLIKDKTAIKPTINLFNNECFTQLCNSNCKYLTNNNSSNNINCWSEQNCQLKCPQTCSNNCNLDKPTKCCNNSLCLYCDSSNECVSCSKFRDLTSGNCVESCPKNTLNYEMHSCIKIEDCSMETNSLIKNYHLFNNSHCLKQCPNGYKSFVIAEKSINISKCIECSGDICKKDCLHKSFTLNTLNDLEMIKDCYRVKRLHIELHSNVSQDLLSNSLKYLEQIDDYLIISRNRHISSLEFLKNLKTIKGVNLFDNQFSLIVHTNNILRDLWQINKDISNFTILNGTIRFYENPELCYEDIERFVLNLNLNTDLVSLNFNGYKRLTCSNRTIDLNVKLEKNKILVSWNIFISDLRRLKGYTISYVEVSDDFLFDKRDVDLIGSFNNNHMYDDGLFEWNYLYIDFDESIYKKNGIVQAKIDVEPFTRYALYVKADLTLDYNWANMDSYNRINRSLLTFETDKLTSQIHYVYSLPSSINLKFLKIFLRKLIIFI